MALDRGYKRVLEKEQREYKSEISSLNSKLKRHVDDLLDQLLSWNPDKRISGAEASKHQGFAHFLSRPKRGGLSA